MTTSPGERVEVPLREQIAEEVRVLLARRRMTGVALAAHIGRSQSYTSRRLTGETAFDLDDLQRIASALGVSLSDLIPAEALHRRRRPTGVQTTRENLALAERPLDRTERTSRPEPPVASRPPDNRPGRGMSHTATSPNVRRPALIRSDRRPLAA